MRINYNISSIIARNCLNNNDTRLSDSIKRLSSGYKINSAADDAAGLAISLKMSAQLRCLKQANNNANDGVSVVNTADGAMTEMHEILQRMNELAIQAANGTNNDKDRSTIAAQLKQYCEFIYQQNANMDYAGRYLFTGYRTDVPLLFEEDSANVTYTMTEELKINNIQKYNYVYGQPEYDDSKSASDYANEASEYLETHRIQLSYNNCDERDVTVTYTDASGKSQTMTAVTKSIADNKTFNEQYHPADDEIYFVPETGELVFGDGVYDSIRAGSNLKVQYSKTNFEKNDIRPEHYFESTAVDNVTGETKNYFNIKEQKINYQVNFSQTLTVNTLGCNAFDTSIGRAVDDIYNVINNLDVMDQTLASVKKRIEDCDPKIR